MDIEQALLQMEKAHKRDTMKEKLVALIYKQAPTLGSGSSVVTTARGSRSTGAWGC